MDPNAVKAAHGFVMAIGWGVCSVLGAFLARYFKHLGHRWFVAHITLNVVGMVCVLTGFLVAFSLTPLPYTKTDALTLLHVWLGTLIVGGGVIAQPFLGWLADKRWQPDRKQVPVFPDIIHWWVGRCCILSALLNCFIGLWILQADIVW